MFGFSSKRFLLLFILAHFLVGCIASDFKKSLSEFKDNSVERIKVSLSSLPVVSSFIKLHPPPEALYREVEERLEVLRVKGVERHLPDEYARLTKRWREAQELYDEKLYLQAEKRLKTLAKGSKEIEEKLDRMLSDLQKEALRKYEEKKRGLLSKLGDLKEEEERLKVRLYLLYLRTLIEQGRLTEFEQELRNDPLG